MLTLITGGAGFIGSHLADMLLARGDDVIIADDLQIGSLGNIDDAMRTARATFVYLDPGRPSGETGRPIVKAAKGRRIDRVFIISSPVSRSKSASNVWQMLCARGSDALALIDVAVDERARFVYGLSYEARLGAPYSSAGLIAEAGDSEFSPLIRDDHITQFAEAADALCVFSIAMDRECLGLITVSFSILPKRALPSDRCRTVSTRMKYARCFSSRMQFGKY
jgi:NAD(P)-dependent dehydrogenase (short-subunit alcohol dehydrogenase family)